MADLAQSVAFDAWIDEARAVDLVGYARARSPDLRRQGSEWVGPCPACGGRDRFSVAPRKGVFHCRAAGRGGDVIALAQYVEGLDFLGAVASLTGRPAPGRDIAETPEDRARRQAAQEARQAAVAAEAHARKVAEDSFRMAEIKRARKFWVAAGPVVLGSAAAAYLRQRGELMAPPGAHLRFSPAHPYVQPGHGGRPHRVLHVGPALLAGLTGADGRFCGVHQTWIDLTRADGKAVVPDPDTGEILPAKKVRGSVHGARIELVRVAEPHTLILGEGIETCLSVYQALRARDLPLWREAAVWSSVSLGNLSGRALDRVRHPSRFDARGRPALTRGPTPDLDSQCLAIPDAVDLVILLGDGDSDPFDTEMALTRARARLARPGRHVGIAWAEPGHDFNDMLRSAA
ncbi:cell Division and Cell Cycle [Methylobacterium phyllosphaerae]|uniref:CHC2 zinc finger n=1 Tax=Methylobacterium phyllosphaerae TaxID=418223 RepID=A0AAE8HSI7_9HYPH|nr:CHC2 zinc finger domain-containing protein [Methylobacterium phyllosphaerae]APT31917.1 cell Division and Cell Cycle [Methylobacterium phyllosphaerae]SFH01607.1 CHC2 zinc finger [Methylobacterium phyllosphaerae]